MGDPNNCVCNSSITLQVETIGDAYVVASGIPEHNPKHASEVAKLGLSLLEKVIVIFITCYNNIFETNRVCSSCV